ncbi:MAG TPA: hypothetical protein VF131_02085 [Blastocatellia bacterium]|nr:hypothetical protein [Blastocatellia bacterium]
MSKFNDTTTEGDIVEINPEQILIDLLNKAISPFPQWLVADWVMKKPARQIAAENGVELKIIYAMLKELNKAIIKVPRISSDEE